MIDTESENLLSFVEFSTRQYEVFTFDVSSFNDWLTARGELLTQIKSKIDSKNLVKVEIVGEHDTAFYIDEKELFNKLNNYYFYAKVVDQTVLRISEQDYLLDKTVRGEFVRLVWESDLTPDQKKKVIALGLSAIKGEEI